VYDYSRISYEVREHAERRAHEAVNERIARRARRPSRRHRWRPLHETLQHALADRRHRPARQT
jgi:hypothetical protein